MQTWRFKNLRFLKAPLYIAVGTLDRIKLFSNDLVGRFLRRPNRFSVYADTSEGLVHAHCANPGRLQELLTPGAELILEKAGRPDRKTQWNLAAVIFCGKVVPLISARANRIAKTLILPGLFPSALGIRPEYRFDHSRFDFQIEMPHGRQALVEVKSCTLSAYGRAMFPDAPTERGLRHIQHLADISEQNPQIEGHVLFVLHHYDTEKFTPNIHTDQQFSIALSNLSTKLNLHAASIHCDMDGTCRIHNSHIPFDFTPVRYVEKNSGGYLLILQIDEMLHQKVGSLGTLRFDPGYYIYAGSAKTNLKSRIARHERTKRKNFHWHIDYLRPAAVQIKALPIYTNQDIECEMANSLSDIGGRPIPKFGSSDCNCSSHLFYFEDNPMEKPDFQNMVLRFRHSRI